jgi:hypothetical protein
LQKLEENLKDDARTVEDVRGFLRTTEKGKIKQSIENCTYIFEHDPLLSGAIRRNNLTGRIDLVKKMPWKQRGIIVTDTDINNLRLYLEKNYDITSEKIARAYMLQMWAEAMVLYKKAIEEDNLLLTFTDEMENYVKELQKEFMPEDTEIGVIEDFLEKKGYSRVCIKMIYCEAMGHSKFDELPKWQSKNIAEILRTLGYEDIGSRKFEEYGGQKAWEKKGQLNMTTDDDDFMKVSSQMKLPFD